ncbi:MAG: precorrin-2 dehydrogenase/sirohydrochlorin ferrochelatase family protein [Terriglobales bacterium]
MDLFPMFLKFAGRRCLVVGAGSVGEGKIETLLRTGAETAVVAPRASERVAEWSSAGKLRWRRRTFRPNDLDSVFMVVAATSSANVNDRVYREARRRGVLCNVVDDPERCDFYYPAVVHDSYEPWLEALAYTRCLLLARVADPADGKDHSHRTVSPPASRKFKKRTRSRST